jgi:cytochrome c553
MAKDLSDSDLQSIADFIAKLAAPEPTADPGNPERLERIRALVEHNHCYV